MHIIIIIIIANVICRLFFRKNGVLKTLTARVNQKKKDD